VGQTVRDVPIVRDSHQGLRRSRHRRPGTGGVMIIDHSARQVFDTCHRKYYWQYIQELDQGRSLPMDEGRAVHEGLYTLYRTGDVSQAMAHMRIERPEGLMLDEERLYAERDIAMRKLVEGYWRE